MLPRSNIRYNNLYNLLEVKMKIKTILSFILVGLMLTLIVGCAKAPQEKITAANAAIEAAKAVGADQYVAEKMQAAQDSLTAALAEIEGQNSKFALGRNYAKAARLLDAARSLAEEATGEIDIRREEFKNEANALWATSQTALKEAQALLKRAPRGKEGKAALDAIQQELKALETSLNEVPNLMASEDYVTARDRMSAAMEKINSIKNELQNAIKKTMGR